MGVYMKNIIELYKLDWRRIFKNRTALLLVIALSIIPSLYAWFNIAALWDPYGNTERLKVAIYSDDQLQNYKDKDVQIGSSLIKSLKNNKSLNWNVEESKESLVNGVKQGKYYAGIYIPRTFSKNLLSFTTGDIVKPKIEYYSNQKTNAIVPKITDKASESLAQTISKNFIETTSSTVIKEMNKIGVSIDDSIPMIRKATNLVFAFEDNQDMIDDYTNEFLVLKDKLPIINEKIEEANTIISLFPSINESAQSIVAMNYRMDDVEKVGELLSSLSDSRSSLKGVQTDVTDFSKRFDSLESILTDGIVASKNLIKVIDSSQSTLKQIDSTAKNVDGVLTDTKKFIVSLKSAFKAISSTIKTGFDSIDMITSSIVKEMEYLIEKINNQDLEDKDVSYIKRGLREINNNVKRDLKIAESNRNILVKLQNMVGEREVLSDLITKLDNYIIMLNSVLEVTNTLIEMDFEEWIDLEKVKSDIESIYSLITNLSQALEEIKAIDVNAEIDAVMDSIIQTLESSSATIKTAQELAPNIYGLMDSSKASLKNIISVMEEFKNKLPAMRAKIGEISDMVSLGIQGINSGLDKAISFYRTDFPNLRTKLNKASDFIQFQLPGIEKELEKEITNINNMLPKINSATDLAADFIKEDYPKLKDANNKIASFLREEGNEEELKEVLKMLKSDAKKESDFFADPVQLVDKALYPIPNYGSSTVPFYTALCLWVGGLLLSSVTTTKFHLDDKMRSKTSKKDRFFARLMTYLTIGTAQAIIVSLGNILLLGVYAANPILHIFSSIIVSLVFMSIIYSLISLFANVGKGLAIIILVLSISAGGGNFPAELSGTFFRIINPMLPFTYAVDLLRETIGGVYLPGYFKSFFILIGFAIVFIVVGTVFHKKISDKFNSLSAKASESHFFS